MNERKTKEQLKKELRLYIPAGILTWLCFNLFFRYIFSLFEWGYEWYWWVGTAVVLLLAYPSVKREFYREEFYRSNIKTKD